MSVTNAKFAGRNCLTKVGNQATLAGATFTTLASCVTNSFAGTQDKIDTTDKDDDVWEKGIQGGIRRVKLTVAGRVTDGSGTQFKTLKQNFEQGLLWTYQFAYGGGDTVSGVFLCTALNIDGDVKDAQKFTATFESQDTPAFVDV